MFWALFLFFAVLLYLYSQRRPRNFPPGPWGFPVLGHLPLLGAEPHKTAMQWKSKYGPVLGIDFASFPCVIISDYHLAKEVFAMESCLGRPAMRWTLDRSGGPAHGHVEGITMTSGQTWKEQRAFTHRCLRQLGGFGTRSMEAIILKEMNEFTRRLKTQAEARAGQAIATDSLFNVAVVNVIWGIVDRRELDQDDPELNRVARLLADGFSNTSIFAMLAIFMPWFYENFPDWMTRRGDIEKLYKPIAEFLEPYVDQHWQTHVAGQPRDFIDAFIDEVKNTTTTDPGSSFHPSRAKSSLVTTLIDLFATGSETSATTLRWVCLLAARFLDVQDEIVREIERVLGARPPSLADRSSMPYTEAFLHEVMRFRPLIPLGVYHNTTEDVHLNGYNIPVNTMVFINVHEAHFNWELWGDDVEEFHPERWLTAGAGGDNGDSGRTFVRRGGFLAFSTGKRVCLGEQLARDELFLFTVGLLQQFRIDPDPNSDPPCLEPKLGGTTQGPKPHKLLFTWRN